MHPVPMGFAPKPSARVWGEATWAPSRACSLLRLIAQLHKRGAMGLTPGDLPPVDSATFMAIGHAAPQLVGAQ
jgi:hypothetical protein